MNVFKRLRGASKSSSHKQELQEVMEREALQLRRIQRLANEATLIAHRQPIPWHAPKDDR